MELRIKKTHPNAIIPFRATKGSAGLDLAAALDEAVVIMPNEMKIISCGIAIELPSKDMVALMISRSSLGFKYGVSLINSVGVIDSDYRGTISVTLFNHSNIPFKVDNGDRLAQLLITPIILPTVKVVEELSHTEREEGGYGSTGKK